MIYVSKRQYEQVEYLIAQSIKGNHLLFDLDIVRKTFVNDDPLEADPVTKEDAYSAEHHIEKLILLPTLLQKRAYLEQLSQEVLQLVVKTYFNIVESNLYENREVRH